LQMQPCAPGPPPDRPPLRAGCLTGGRPPSCGSARGKRRGTACTGTRTRAACTRSRSQGKVRAWAGRGRSLPGVSTSFHLRARLSLADGHPGDLRLPRPPVAFC
jgi:hypothetical protein